MWFVGMDVHLKTTSVCILDGHGRKVKAFTVRGPWKKVVDVLREIHRPFAVCYEASCGYGWLYDRLRPLAAKVVVAHPGQLRLIFRSKRKNDRIDAERLAKLLYLDEVPPAYVPSLDVRSWRAMIEHRQRLMAGRVRTKNSLRALLRSHALAPPGRLWTRKGLAWLKSLDLPTVWDQLRRDQWLDQLAHYNSQLKTVERALEKIACAHPGITLLRSIPGVGIRTAEAVLAYIDKPDRFARNKAVGSYFGLVPSQDASAGVNRLGHITRQGPATVRQLLTEAAWQAIRRSPRVRRHFERIGRGDPERRKIALVATAHYLLRVMHAMLRSGELWRDEAA